MTSSPCRRALCKGQGIFALCVCVWGGGGGGGQERLLALYKCKYLWLRSAQSPLLFPFSSFTNFFFFFLRGWWAGKLINTPAVRRALPHLQQQQPLQQRFPLAELVAAVTCRLHLQLQSGVSSSSFVSLMQLRGLNRHTQLCSRGLNTHTQLGNRGLNTHAQLCNRGLNTHTQLCSRGLNTHTQFCSRGLNTHTPLSRDETTAVLAVAERIEKF